MSRIERTIAAQRRALTEREQQSVDRLHRYHVQILDVLQDDLDAVTLLIEEAIANGEPVNIDWLRRQENYHRLMEQVQQQYAMYEPLVSNEVVDAKRYAVQRTSDDAIARAEALGLRTNVMYATFNTEALVALTGALSPDSPLRSVISSHGPRAMEIIESELVRGMGRGSGANEIVREIRRRIGGEADVSRVRALTRTEMLRSYRTSLFQQYDRMGFTHWRWSSALSTRTCLACLSMHGKLFPMSDPFMPSHVNCRCSPQPATATSRLVGPTGEEYVRSLSPETQAVMIGNRDAYSAFRRGEISLDDFRGVYRSNEWGNAIYQKSGSRVMRERAA